MITVGDKVLVLRTLLVGCCLLLLIRESAGSSSFDDDDDHDEALDEYFLGLFEGLRVIMPIGFPEFGLPVLEPLAIEEQEINFRNDDTRIYLKVQNVSGEGLSSYKIPFLRVSLPGFRLRVTVVVPSFKARGTYRLNGTAFSLLPLKGHGKFRVRITNLTISIALQMIQSGEKIIMKVDKLTGDMAEFNSHFDNLMSDGNLSLVINSLVRTHARRFIGELLKRLKKPIEDGLVRFTEIIDTTIFADFGKKSN